MKIKNTFKSIITVIIIAAMLITSFNTGYAVTTATAATTTDTFNNGDTITLKVGDVKKLLVNDESGKDIATKYTWTSSDKSIATSETDFFDATKDLTECLIITANAPGTVTITGTGKKTISLGGEYGTEGILKAPLPDVSITVNVAFPKPTKKQKKCKHKYKTTKKATCETVGVKTCKKCKFQKTTAKTAHEYATEVTTTYGYSDTDYTAFCYGCYCEDPEEAYLHEEYCLPCDNKCGMTWKLKDYGTVSAMEKAIWEHVATCPGRYDRVAWGYADSGEPTETTTTREVCTHCGKVKE